MPLHLTAEQQDQLQSLLRENRLAVITRGHCWDVADVQAVITEFLNDIN